MSHRTPARRRAVALSLLMLFTLLAGRTPADAAPQDAKTAEQERLAGVMSPSADVEEFRRELSDYFSDWEETLRLLNSVPAVRLKLARAGFYPLAAVAEGKRQLALLGYSDLVRLRAAYAANPGWREAPRALGSHINPALRKRLAARAATAGGDAVSPNSITDNCSDGLNAGITNTDLSIAEAAVIAAETAMEALPTDALTVAGHAAAAIAVGAAKGALLSLQTLKAIADDCSGASFEAAIQQQLADAKSDITSNDNANKAAVVANDNANRDAIVSNDNTNKNAIVANSDANRAAVIADAAANRAAVTTKIGDTGAAVIANDNANKAAIVANDNANRDAIVSNDNANKNTIVANDNANTLLLLRVQLEADLAAPDGSTPVALFETPETQCAGAAPLNQCGLLGMTRALVVQTIARLAGSSAAQANAFLAKGDQYRAAGDYRSAYAQYRLAYKAAAR